MHLKEKVSSPKTTQENELFCICDAKLEKCMQPYTEYAEIICDMCNEMISNKEYIYHCSNGKNKIHTAGYDLCLQCVGRVKEMKIQVSNLSFEMNQSLFIFQRTYFQI